MIDWLLEFRYTNISTYKYKKSLEKLKRTFFFLVCVCVSFTLPRRNSRITKVVLGKDERVGVNLKLYSTVHIIPILAKYIVPHTCLSSI